MEAFLDYNMPLNLLDHQSEWSQDEGAFVVRIVVLNMEDEEVQDIVRSIIDFSSLSLFDPQQRNRHSGTIIIKIFEESYDLEEPLQIITMRLTNENTIEVAVDEEGSQNGVGISWFDVL